MEDKVVVKPFSELPDLRCLGLQDWGLPKDWGICVVGTALRAHGVGEGTYCVKHFEMVDGAYARETFYPVPDSVVVLIKPKRDGLCASSNRKFRPRLASHRRTAT
jgi:hypothetical protein